MNKLISFVLCVAAFVVTGCGGAGCLDCSEGGACACKGGAQCVQKEQMSASMAGSAPAVYLAYVCEAAKP